MDRLSIFLYLGYARVMERQESDFGVNGFEHNVFIPLLFHCLFPLSSHSLSVPLIFLSHWQLLAKPLIISWCCYFLDALLIDFVAYFLNSWFAQYHCMKGVQFKVFKWYAWGIWCICHYENISYTCLISCACVFCHFSWQWIVMFKTMNV